MKVLICGDRNLTDYDFFATSIYRRTIATEEHLPITEVIHGGARGADTLAGLYAERHKVPCKVFMADWNKYGKSAGPIRNKQMLDEGKPDFVIAFLAQGSKGTKNMIEQAEKAGVKVVTIPL